MKKTACPKKRLQRHPKFLLKPLTLTISLLFLGTAPTAVHADAGVTDLGWLGPIDDRYAYSIAYGVNSAGDVVVGFSIPVGSSGTHAFRWTQTTGMTDLGTLQANNTGNSVAYDVNAAGNVVVGDTFYSGASAHAFRWTQASGMSDLGTLANDKTTGQSFAYGVNAAGDVVVGQADNGTAQHAFRWTLNAGSSTQGTMTDLGTLAAGNGGSSIARDVNAAGDVVVGQAYNGTAQHAFRWTQASGMSDLGTLASDKTTGASVAYGVNAAGDVVVGQADNGTTNQAFRWTSANGMQSIEAWLTANGVTVNAAAPKTSIAYGVNAAGDVVVGRLANNHAFIATTKGSTTESQTTKGLLDLVENQKSLAGASGTPSHAIQDASLVMHGAHGSPMRGLLTAGKQDFWLAGDWGQRENQGNAGNLGAGEIGYARGVGDQVMVKLALGRTYSKQDTVFGGNTRVDGTYIMPEIIAKLSGTPLYATFSAYYNWSDTEVTRGYDNAGTREYGRGSADVNTAAVRARLDWLDAITAGKTSFTPYASVTDTRSRVGAYRETGGAFPASWNSRTEHSTESRLGLDAVHRVGDQLNVLGRLEGVHQFNNTGAAASGDVAGLYGFSLPGQTYKRDWLRAAIGFEGKMGAGTGTLMLNASTQSDATTYWVAASYRMAF